MLVVARLPGTLYAQAFPYGYGEVILFDPLEAATICSVLCAPDSEKGRALFGKERPRIAVSTAAKDLVAVRAQ